MTDPMQVTDYPQGIDRSHVECPPGRTHANPLPLLFLTAVMLLALIGWFGGGRSPTLTADSAAVRLDVHTPVVIRNGQFFETRIRVTPRRRIAKLVVAVSPSLWRDLTQNSMVPQADKETFEDGRFRFDYGAGEPGEPLELKIDFQINPALFGHVAGVVEVYDDKILLVRLPVRMTVRP
ncbi:hypothetical protein [uncultured Sphingomonas sp.]|uniref:hypothetical protein n=1 Tax=uncultured Sphingomonas sp. TaxID=158754 RepID=UPI0025FD6699|nr:hypothetical protein [uncultured Sphingomonas sp.]